MRDLFSQIWEDLEKTYNYHSLDGDVDYEGQEPEVLGAEEFAASIAELVQDVISLDSNYLEEGFASSLAEARHFWKHCLAGIETRKSTKVNIYYDFSEQAAYSKLENSLMEGLRDSIRANKKSTKFIWSLLDAPEIARGFH